MMIGLGLFSTLYFNDKISDCMTAFISTFPQFVHSLRELSSFQLFRRSFSAERLRSPSQSVRSIGFDDILSSSANLSRRILDPMTVSSFCLY